MRHSIRVVHARLFPDKKSPPPVYRRGTYGLNDRQL